MESLSQITRALGDAKALWRLRRGPRTVAEVARWRHKGAVIDLSGADAYQVVFNLSGGQVVDSPERAGAQRIIRAGSVAINAPEDAGVIRVHGQAETLQILISPDLIRSTHGNSTTASPALATTTPKLRAAAVQALIALENGTGTDESELERIVLETAKCFVGPSLLPVRVSHGGLSPGARRRVSAVFHDWSTDPAKPSPTVPDLASAAGLSLYHFIRSFHRTEGQTPNTRLLAERVSRALELLLRTEAPIQWISDVTYFSSPSHFVSTFRRRTGVTPGAFRLAARRKP